MRTSSINRDRPVALRCLADMDEIVQAADDAQTTILVVDAEGADNDT
jgi:hypothetical protein